MKTTKNQSPVQRQAVIDNARLKGTTEKMKCIKNSKTGKVDKLRKSVCEEIIKDNPDWHFTTKRAYEHSLLEAIKPGPTIMSNSSYKPKGKPYKGQFKDKTEKQVIVTEIENPDYDKKHPEKNVIPVYSKPRKAIKAVAETNAVPGFNSNYQNTVKVEQDITVKVPGNEKDANIVTYRRINPFIKVVKIITHLLVHGKRTSQLVK